jgi:putative transposase
LRCSFICSPSDFDGQQSCWISWGNQGGVASRLPLKDWGMRSSMSRKGNCWEDLGFCHNAPTERFWGRLKTARVQGHKFATREQAKQAVLDWMAFYNHRRLHSSLGCLSPMPFEQRGYEAQLKKVA